MSTQIASSTVAKYGIAAASSAGKSLAAKIARASGAGFLLFALAIPGVHSASAQTASVTRVQAPEKRVVIVEALVDAADEQESARARQDADQEKRDAEREKRDQARASQENLDDQLDLAREALDDGQYKQAAKMLADLSRQKSQQSDAVLYWLAYAQNKSASRAAALATLADLKSRFPNSRWQKDAAALDLEIRQSSGAAVNPEVENNEDLKLLAIQSLMNSDPERAVPMLQKVLAGNASPRLKAKALFVLAQGGSPQAMEIIGKVASGQANPELQRKAVEYLGIFGGAEGGVEGGVKGGVKGGVSGGRNATEILASVYSTSTDESVKRQVLKSYMISGNKAALFNAAKSEKNEDLKREAIQQLGLVGGQAELNQLYSSETSVDIRRDILQSFFLAGDSQRLVQVANTEKNTDLRLAAIRNLGLMGSSDTLQSIYTKETDRGIKEEILNAYFLGGNAKALIAIAKSEKDMQLKKTAIEKLSLMGSKEGDEYMMEILDK